MSHIFISYSKKDFEFAEKLRQVLQDKGFVVWMDETRLSPHEKWWTAIEQNIISCGAFIVIMSPSSQESDWVEREILVAEKYRKPIFPVLLAGEGWTRLANIQYQNMTIGLKLKDLNSSFVDSLQKFVPTHTGIAAPPPLPISAVKAKRAMPSTRRWLVIFILLALNCVAIFIIPSFLEGSYRANETSTAQAVTQVILALTPTLNPVERVQTLDAQASLDAEMLVIARATMTEQSRLDMNASATAQTTLDAESSAIARIASYETATAFASITPSLTATSTLTSTLTPSSTPTLTPRPSNTSRPSSTPTLTHTPRPSRTPTATSTLIPLGAILYESDFSTGTLAGNNWLKSWGDFLVGNDSSGNRVLKSIGGGEIRLHPSLEWDTYFIELRFKIVDWGNDHNLLFTIRPNDDTCRGFNQIINGTIMLTTHSDDNCSSIRRIPEVSLPLATGDWHTLQMQVLADSIVWRIDENHWYIADDYNYEGRQFVISSLNIGELWIDDIRIRAIND